MNKIIHVLSGTRLARFGGGYFSTVIEDKNVAKYGDKVKSFEISFDVVKVKGSEGSLTGYEYEYNVFHPDLSDIKDAMIVKAIMVYVMDDMYQSALNKEMAETAKSEQVLNLTQHNSTPEQGCVEPVNKEAVKAALTFDSIPNSVEMYDRAVFLAGVCKEVNASKAMIGGAPFFMSTLERVLIANGIQPLYAFSERVSEEKINADGTVTKINVFKHVGFVEVI